MTIKKFFGWAFPISFFMIFGIFVWVGYTSIQAQYEMNKVRLKILQLQNDPDNVSPQDLAEAISDFRKNIAAANHYTSGPMWWIARRIPYLGRTPAAIQTLTKNLNAVMQNSQALEYELRQPTFSSEKIYNAQFFANLLEHTTEVKPAFQTGAHEFKQLNYSGVPGFIAKPVQQVGEGFISLAPLVSDAAIFKQVVPSLFGFDQPRTWMLVFLNGAEARSIGGFPGGWGILNVSRGHLSLTEVNDDVKINLQSLQNWNRYVSTDQAALYGDDLSRWSDMNLSPDFPTNARLMSALLLQSTGLKVDGVLTMNEHALASMLAVTGPIKQGNAVLTQNNVEKYVTQGIYQDYQNGKEKNSAILGIIEQVFAKLSGGAGGPIGAFRAFIPPVQDRNIQLWSSNSDVEKHLITLPAGGSLSDVENPTHAVVMINGAGNKIDSYIKTDVQLQQGICQMDAPYRNSFMRISFNNQAPTQGLPNYVIPRADLLRKSNKYHGSTKMIAYIHAPLGAEVTEATLNDKLVSLIDSGIDSNRQVWRFDLELPAKSESVFFLKFDEPAVGDEVPPMLWTQIMANSVTKKVTLGPRCIR